MTRLTEERLRQLLGRDREMMPSPAVDAAVRAMLRTAPIGPHRLRRAELAAALAVAALVALTLGLATVFAAGGAAEQGPLLALISVTAYLGLSSAAALPLLLGARARRAAAAGGIAR